MRATRLIPVLVVAALSGAACGSSTVVSGSGSGTTVSAAASGIEGVVSSAPSCPVEQLTNPCPPRPVAVPVRIVDTAGAAVASGRSDRLGHYRLSVAPGRYEVVAAASNPGRGCQPVWVQVPAGQWVRADLSCDTGIR